MNSSETRTAVLIPAYNSGGQLARIVRAVREIWQPVFVVLDGTTDGSAEEISRLAAETGDVRVLRHAHNEGKGAAVLSGMRAAAAAGFTHAITLDADGQHAPRSIPEFAELSRRQPGAMILGVPVFGSDAPWERVYWRRLGNFLADLETGGAGIGDSLFGLRLYPIAPFLRVMESIRTARRFDFDTEIAVRLVWEGIVPINHPAPVIYPPRREGGVTHFRYLRDNLLLAGTHFRLLREAAVRLRQREHSRPCPAAEADYRLSTGVSPGSASGLAKSANPV